MKKAMTRWGPRKLSAEAYAAQQDKQRRSSRSGTVYGGRKATTAPEPAEAVSVAGAQTQATGNPSPSALPSEAVPGPNPYLADDADGRLNLGPLEQRLRAHPEELDLAIQAEFQGGRPPRKGALSLFREFEDGRDGGPRPSVVKLLTEQGG